MTIVPNTSLYSKKSLVKVSIFNDVVLFVFQHVYSPFVSIFIVLYLPFSLQYQSTQALQMHYSIFKSNNNLLFVWLISQTTPIPTMHPRWLCKWLLPTSRSLVTMKHLFNILSAYTWSSLVCSTIEDFDFMYGCINAGASEYLIKPLRADVIRTLPLVTISSNTTRSTRLTALLLFRNCTDISLQHCYIIVWQIRLPKIPCKSLNKEIWKIG